MNKINYHLISLEEVKKFVGLDHKPTLLLNACCAPCSSHTLRFVCQYFDVTILYDNSNVFPLSEFTIRRDEIEWFVSEFNKRENQDVKILFSDYDHDNFMHDLRPLASEKEGGKRCELCYEKKIEEALRYGQENGFDYATTTLTISRQKNSQLINQIASKVAQKYPKIKYFFSDFKKDGGLDEVQQMKRDYALYQQTYCGCEYSLAESKRRKKPRLED
jgi:hypothetical protein